MRDVGGVQLELVRFVEYDNCIRQQDRGGEAVCRQREQGDREEAARYSNDGVPDPHPQGYTLQGSGTPANPANATNWNPSFGWTAGAFISTLSDLLTYDHAVGTGQGLMSPATQTDSTARC